MTQNKKQSIKTSIKLLDDAHKIIMDLILGNDVEDFLDDVQYKIETISLDKFEKEIEEIERIQKDNN